MSAKAGRTAPSRNTGPKILRVGIIQNGKIIEERLLRKQGPVTVGHHPKNSFHVPVADIPKSATLFEHKNNQYQLIFTEKMSGRVSLGDGVHDLDKLRASGKAQKRSDGWAVPLTERSRGKLVLGEVTLLFQFVTPPPPRQKPQLPATMRGGWVRNLDWTFLVIMGMSALIQGGSVFWVQAQDWPEPRDVQGLPDRFVQILQVKDDEPDKNDENLELEKLEGEGEAEPEKKEPEKVAKKEPKKVDPDKRAADEAVRKKALSKAVENKTILKKLGSISPDGGSLVDALSSGADRRSLDEAFAGSTGVESATAGVERSGLRRAGSADATGVGGRADIGDLKVKGAGDTKVDTGTKSAAVAVKGRVSLKGRERVVGSGVIDKDALSRVFRSRGSALRSCYERELKKNPKIGGKLVIQFTIGAAGRVTSASVASDSVGAPAVGSCVVSRVKSWKFPKPEGGSVSVSKSILFAPGS